MHFFRQVMGEDEELNEEEVVTEQVEAVVGHIGAAINSPPHRDNLGVIWQVMFGITRRR